MLTSNVECAAVSAIEKVTGRKQHGQFNHVASYARKISAMSGKARKDKKGNVVKRKLPRQWTVGDIAKEADRDPESSPHVKQRLAPVLLRGAPPSELERLCDEMMIEARQADGKRAVRSDTHVLLGAVYSLPYRPEDYLEYREVCTQFFEDAMKFHEKRYGKIVSAVIHFDEAMLHGHFWTLDPDAKNLIPGWRAKREEMKRQLDGGASKKEAIRQGNFAYKEAMKLLQDEFFIEVGEPNGLARYGDKRMRYQPGEAHLKRADREAHAAALRKAREEEELIRKKIEEDRAEAIKKNLEAAQEAIAAREQRLKAEQEAFEAQQERLRAEHLSEYIARERERAENERETAEKVTKRIFETPEFQQLQFIQELEAKIAKMKTRNRMLREEIAVQHFTIGKLEKENKSLRNRLKQLRNTVRSVIERIRDKFLGGGKKNGLKL
jgi:hypothetical protein